MQSYFGSYERFETAGKKEAAVLLGADNTIGDVDDVSIEYRDAHHEAWIVSRFDQRLGYFAPAFSRELAVRDSAGLTTVAILSLVGYTDTPDPGHYWGEAAVISYDARDEALAAFVERLAAAIAEGRRPNVDLGAAAIEAAIAADATWLPTETVPLPEREKGTVFMKKHRSFSERMIEKGRQRNIGCYIVSWAFLLALVALIVWAVVSCIRL